MATCSCEQDDWVQVDTGSDDVFLTDNDEDDEDCIVSVGVEVAVVTSETTRIGVVKGGGKRTSFSRPILVVPAAAIDETREGREKKDDSNEEYFESRCHQPITHGVSEEIPKRHGGRERERNQRVRVKGVLRGKGISSWGDMKNKYSNDD